MRRKGYSGGVIPPATFADGGITWTAKEGGRVPQTSGQLSARIATIKRAMRLGQVTPQMTVEMKGLMSQLRRQVKAKRR